MELDILQLHTLTLPPPGGLKQHLVIEAKPELRHPREVGSHLDHAHNLRSQHVSLGSGKEVDTLDDIDEDFVLAILDAIRPPGHGIGHHLTDPVKQTKQHRDVGVPLSPFINSQCL